MDPVERACQALNFQRAMGHEARTDAFALHVVDRSAADVRASNFTTRVRATSQKEVEQVLASADDAFPHCAHRRFYCDPTTPAIVMAGLVARGFGCERQLVMTRRADLAARDRELCCDPVQDAGSWRRLAALVHEAELETASSNFLSGAAKQAELRLQGFRTRAPSYEAFVVRRGRTDVGYVAGVACPGGVGVVGELFVLMTARRSGLGTELLRHAAQELRDSGSHHLVMEVTPGSPAQALAESQGFAPLCLTEIYETTRRPNSGPVRG